MYSYIIHLAIMEPVSIAVMLEIKYSLLLGLLAIYIHEYYAKLYSLIFYNMMIITIIVIKRKYCIGYYLFKVTINYLANTNSISI